MQFVKHIDLNSWHYCTEERKKSDEQTWCSWLSRCTGHYTPNALILPHILDISSDLVNGIVPSSISWISHSHQPSGLPYVSHNCPFLGLLLPLKLLFQHILWTIPRFHHKAGKEVRQGFCLLLFYATSGKLTDLYFRIVIFIQNTFLYSRQLKWPPIIQLEETYWLPHNFPFSYYPGES